MTGSTTPALRWNTPGTYNLSLSADNGACIDSVVHTLAVAPLPPIIFNQTNPRICLGDTHNLSVQGSYTYTWRTNTTLRTTGNGTSSVWPATDSWFAVNALSIEGCTNTDSVRVAVVQPFNITAKENYEACTGQTISLSATGANRYQWVPAAGLSNAAIANPVASVTVSTQYRVIGFDAAGCFADTVQVQVTIHPLPQVNAGPDAAVLGGSDVQLNASATLQNVTWRWQPATYLSCTNCANPISRPLNDISYLATATTLNGCSASDTIKLTVLCAADRIFIPTGFTPNGDGLNDRFGILGGGFTLIRHFSITDRWGKVVFERKNAQPGDATATWNGKYPNGIEAPSGTYIYAAVVECVTGESFSYKGTITLVR